MSRDTAREAVNKKLVQKQDVPKVFNGFLGNYENVVIVPGRLNYVYVTMADGMVTQAYNVIAPTILKLPVVCGYDQNQLSSGLLKVISVRNIPRQTNTTTPTTNFLNNHHKSHEWMATDGGTDPTMIELRQFMPLRPTPVSPQSIYINRGVLHIGGAWRVVGGQTVLLSQYIPSSYSSGSSGGEYSGSDVQCRYVTISIDAASGSAVVTSGSAKSMTAISLLDIPEAPAGNYPICAVQLYNGQTDIVEARTRTDLIDLRYGMSSALTPVHDNLGGLNAGNYLHITPAQVTYYNSKIDNVMSTTGDMLFFSGSGVPFIDTRLKLSGSATAISVYQTNYANNVLDGNDTTYWAGASNPVADDWIYIDFGSIKTISGYKIYQFPYNGDWGASRFKVQITDNAVSGSWVDVDDVSPTTDTVTRALSAIQSCRYVRFYAVTGGGNSWNVYTIEIYEQPTFVRLPIGSEGTVLTSASGVPAWKAITASGSQVVPLSHVPVANYYLTGYNATSGSFSSGSVTAGAVTSGSHNDLSGLQGGTSDEYYHLTSAERAIATQASGSGTNGYLTSTDWLRFNATSGSGGISDAPIDGKQYGRKDGAWTEIVAGGSQVVPLAHVPVTNFYLTGYDSASGSWTSGSVVGGTSGSGGGIEEAPNDGKQYGRQSLGWTEIVSGSGASGGADVLMVQVFS